MREKYLQEGFNDYLSKPIEVEKLEAMLAKHLPPELVSFQVEKQRKIIPAAPSKIVSDGFTGVQEKYQPTFVAPDAEILIVDDNEMNLLVAKRLLAATRIKIDTAASGVICLEKIARKHYDLIFMDQLMSNLSGIQTLAMARSMRENLSRDTPVDMELMELMLLTYLPLEKIHSE